MERAGMLDGDLVTHINGDGASPRAPDELVWNSKVCLCVCCFALVAFIVVALLS